MSVLGHFGLSTQPFGVTPDPRFMFNSSTHREALACLQHGIGSDRGFTALIAEPGMGKTTLLFRLLQTLKGKAKTAFLFQTLCGPQEFLAALLVDLGVDDCGESVSRMQSKLNEYLLQQGLEQRPVVLVIDEAQNLDAQVLEVIRMLSNFETSRRKLMHVVLAGQSELAKKLTTPGLSQLRQRVSIIARLNRLGAQETREYIEHRLRMAGWKRKCASIFAPRAVAMIAEHSLGIPRNINNLCFNSMSLACALKQSIVDAKVVQECVEDLELSTIISPSGLPRASEESETVVQFLSRRWPFKFALGRRALFMAILAWLTFLGFIAGKALSERTTLQVQNPQSNSDLLKPAPLAVHELAQAKSQEPSISAVRQNSNANEPLDSATSAPITLGSHAGAKRRTGRRRQSARERARPDTAMGWSAKFASSLYGPRLIELPRNAKVQPGTEEALVALPTAPGRDKP